MQVKNIMVPNILVGPALAYGGLVQLLAGMWYVSFPLALGTCILTYVLGKWSLETPLVRQSSHPTVGSGLRRHRLHSWRVRNHAHLGESRRQGNVLRPFLHVPLREHNPQSTLTHLISSQTA